MNQQVHSRTDVVYRRTSKGQAAAMPSATSAMNDEHRRLLLLVNGFTSLDVLARVGHFEDAPDQVARTLKSSGLIEEAGGYPAETFMRAPWREPPEH
jgi:hypothetical protein